MILDFSERVGLIIDGKIQDITMIDVENKLVLSGGVWYPWDKVRFTNIFEVENER